MGDPLQFKPDRNFAPLLATTCVLLLGAATCIAIVFSSGEVKPVPVAIAVSMGLGTGFLLWSLRDRPIAHRRNWFAWVNFRPSRKERVTYELRVVQPRVTYGDKRPPTLEDLRDQQDATRTWVPTQHRQPRGPSSSGGPRASR